MDFLHSVDDNMIILGAIGILLALGILLATNRLRKVGAMAAKGVLGIAAIWGINSLLAVFGFDIAGPGINLLTAAVVTFLGLPGVIMLYGLNFFM